jgi:similar to stage IV sporulation protein
MLTILNLLRGYFEIRITGRFPERFLNICSANGVSFWRLERVSSDVLIARVRINEFDRLCSLAERALCEVEVLGRHGAPFFLFRFKKRYIFLAGFALCLFCVFQLSLRVWDIEVTGNETVSEELILKHLYQLGIKSGVRSSSIDPESLEDIMLLRISELSWFTVNVSGSRAVVEVRERVIPPEVVDESKPCNIVARKAGIIEKLSVLEGSAHTALGSTVTEGQLLVSGIVDNVSGARIVHAMADVTAKTWYTLEAKMPCDVDYKSPTGNKASKYSVIIAGNRINLYLNSSFSFDRCDKIVERTRLGLPGGFMLPITIEKVEASEYNVIGGQLDGYDSEEVLKAHLYDRLTSMAPKAEVVSAEYEFDVSGGILTAVLTAECLEDISLTAEIPIDKSILEIKNK